MARRAPLSIDCLYWNAETKGNPHCPTIVTNHLVCVGNHARLHLEGFTSPISDDMVALNLALYVIVQFLSQQKPDYRNSLAFD